MAGRTFGAVVKTPALSRDREGFATFNAAQAEDFPTEPPARSVAESRLMLNPAAEIGAIAYKPA